THGREVKLPVQYRDLLRLTFSVPLLDKNGMDTLWEKVTYDLKEWEHIREALVRTYAILKTEGDLSFIKHLDVARIDYCTFSRRVLELIGFTSDYLERFSTDFGS
ncbi:MAG: hypothetical protein J7497_06445, partial [Chitinophagaceae bacterium]|nr:hypothetical protein [Chitinophagaceae bacterium]